MKKLIIFDLDGTLAESKSALTADMSNTLSELLLKYSVAIISGGTFNQFQKQFLSNLTLNTEQLNRLYLFPTCATSFYRYDNTQHTWYQVYSQDLTLEEKGHIWDSIECTLKDVSFDVPTKIFGPQIEDRGTQITFSALGQSAPVELKKAWDPDQKKRLEIVSILNEYIPEFEIRSGGSTSVDVTRKGIDKAYGIKQIKKYLDFDESEMLFIGDALYEGGNDAPVKSTGVDCIETSGPEQTIQIIEHLLHQ